MVNDGSTNGENGTAGRERDIPANNGRRVASSRRSFLKAAGAGGVVGIAGCLGGGGGVGDTVRIGHLAPLALDMGLGSERSGQMAVDEINDEGGILDTDVEFISADDEGLPSTAQTEADRLINEENIDFLVGTFTSESTQGIMDLVGQSDVPFFISGSADPATMQDTLGEDYETYKNIFRPNPVNTDYQVAFSSEYAEFLSDEHGWTQFAHLPEEAAWTRAYSEQLPDLLEEKGLDVVFDDRLSRDTDDFVPVLNQIESEGAEVIFKFFAHIPGPGMLAAWRENQYPFAQEGTNVASMSPQYWGDTNGGCEFETTSESGGGGAAEITEKTQPFVEAYQDRFADEGRPTLPMYMGFGTYDAIHLYKDVVERAGTADYENDLDDIVDAGLNSDFTGATGRIRFHGPDHEYPQDAIGDLEELPFTVTQWHPEGNKECVWPTQFASADHIVPSWLE